MRAAGKSAHRSGAAADASGSLANQGLRLALFDHLPTKQTPKDPDSVEGDRILHPATLQLGAMFSKGVITSDDDRAHALVLAFYSIIQDYTTPPNRILREDLDKYIGKQVQYLVESRQLTKGMGNIIKFLKLTVNRISPEVSELEAKSAILAKLKSFVEERLEFAAEIIADYVAATITDDDVVLTLGSSPLIRKLLLTAAARNKRFRLTVVDTRPLHEGLQTLAALSPVIPCIYSPLSGAAVAMTDVTKVILGASCLLSNGTMLAPAGTAMVAALAKARQIPVIVASESYKFSDKVQLDSIVFNELGHTSEIVTAQEVDGAVVPVASANGVGYRGSAESKSAHGSRLPFDAVNLRYDLTPLASISVVATETGLIPPTSVPVLIRELQFDQSNYGK